MRAFLLTAIFALTGCADDRPDQWNAFIYSDADDLSKFETIEGFKTFELCQRAAMDRLRATGAAEQGDYECGHKCRFDTQLKVNVCKETRK
ncbi:hypothetical protein [Sphingopyxis sp. QXT-31]|uniref:hypothetical protein n=1 Tax=Sphingopyxis sp. QXT-31 TaxID=1357916 RepID=UPI0012EB3736|nr:hypothetical protein [Sphingopyxis sp. QXT-31]